MRRRECGEVWEETGGAICGGSVRQMPECAEYCQEVGFEEAALQEEADA